MPHTRIFFDPIPDTLPIVFEWAQSLPPENLQAVAIFDEEEIGFGPNNWDSLAHAPIEHGPVDTAYLFIFKQEPAEKGEVTEISGLYYHRGDWQIIPPDALPQLYTLDPEQYTYCRPSSDVIFVNVKDAFPSCPVTCTHTGNWQAE